MACLPRLYLLGCAEHIIQLGNNREACFYDDVDNNTDAVHQKQDRGDGREYLESIKDQLLRGDTKRLNCDVPVELYKKLKIKAIKEDSSITSVINRLVADYVRS